MAYDEAVFKHCSREEIADDPVGSLTTFVDTPFTNVDRDYLKSSSPAR